MERLTKIANKCHTDKGTEWEDSHGYTEFYQRFFEKYEHPNILEIGTYLGRSAKMFEDFYDGDCKIWTLDWASECKDSIKDVPTAEFVLIDLNDENRIKEVHEMLKNVKFDIIIDDASHIWQHQMKALYYFNDLLSDNGIYVLEDIHYSRLFWDMDQSPLFFLTFMKPVCTLNEEQNKELLEKIDQVEIFSRKNETTEDMRKLYGGRSITAIITFNK